MLADAKALTFLPQKTLANKGSDETASCNLFRLGARGSAHILQSRPIELFPRSRTLYTLSAPHSDHTVTAKFEEGVQLRPSEASCRVSRILLIP
ncbi:hypothetical protein CBS147320_7799 [Aspergillus niger]|nr:hypothetical protein CBS11232_6595 [Aspergillus niger]KAI2865553.1 hypothetical protein CBS12448_1850 [Aspergillus niger]KAI2876682.1 hypothetical protein CBS115988_4455 [Aspergillus niger]KAI2884572.1 hypothetical protein CBS13152_7898 [Aspergillus niger]KAI2890651.1 hypothetical protein CBS11852_6325 [Aspergillus niger]